MKVCPICGKLFACWPDFWPYRRGDYYLCSENCKIVFDTREFREKSGWINDHNRKKEEEGKMRKLTLEQKKKAVEIAIAGGDPLKYLEECGSKNPSAHWYYIKKTLKEKDPGMYEQITKGMKIQLKDEAPEDRLDGFEPFEMNDGRRKVTTCCAPSTREGVEVPDNIPEVTLTAKSEDLNMLDEPMELHRIKAFALDDDFEIYGLKTKAGDFQTAAGNLCWTFDGFQMNLPVERWRQLIETVPKVLNVMKL